LSVFPAFLAAPCEAGGNNVIHGNCQNEALCFTTDFRNAKCACGPEYTGDKCDQGRNTLGIVFVNVKVVPGKPFLTTIGKHLFYLVLYEEPNNFIIILNMPVFSVIFPRIKKKQLKT